MLGQILERCLSASDPGLWLEVDTDNLDLEQEVIVGSPEVHIVGNRVLAVP